MTIKKKIRKSLFHPFELGFCGFSNSGKTTLISKIIDQLSSELDIGYVKHDVHKFHMDKEGKDTYKAWHSGARQVFISDITHTANIHRNTPDFVEMRTALTNCDVVFLEGYKNFDVNKIVVLDERNEILKLVEEGTVTEVKLFIGRGERPNLLPEDIPYFQRDEIEKIKNWILSYYSEQINSTPLYGLVLAGGRSQRMKTDKAQLEYHDRPQAEYVFNLISTYCEHSFLSCRKDQWGGQLFGNLPQIHDTFLNVGPMGGILSAMQAHPLAAWLVVACDLPFINRESLEYLIANRNPFKVATCYKSETSDAPEPLCTIYEPKSFSRLLQFLSVGYQCPRKVLWNSPIQMLDQINMESLKNINMKEEYIQAKKILAGKEGVL